MLINRLISNTDLELEISGIASDSRLVQAGNLFISIPSVVDNKKQKDNIQQAIIKGAVAIVTDLNCHFYSTTIPVIAVENPARECALIAAKYFTNKPKYIMAVTGTNGKTSSVRFYEQIVDMCGQKSLSIGSLGVSKFNQVYRHKTHQFTSMDALSLHQVLNQVAEAGYNHVALEATSHGLDQYRLDNIDFHAAAFTNLTQDHLDYHQTMDRYFQAKTRLFTELLPAGNTAIINADIPQSDALIHNCQARGHNVIRFGYQGHELKLLHLTADNQGQYMDLEVFGTIYKNIYLPLIGQFQVYNALVALGMAISCPDIKVEQAIQALSKLHSIPGRMQYVGIHNGGTIYVDYAHSPDSLKQLLSAARMHCPGQLQVLFGCGGERDQPKRQLMGEIANALADVTYITDDNPRFEDPAKIRQDIINGAPGSIEIAGRREAITTAINNLKPDDILLIAGKGHEEYQIIGAQLMPFNDYEIAHNIISERKTA